MRTIRNLGVSSYRKTKVATVARPGRRVKWSLITFAAIAVGSALAQPPRPPTQLTVDGSAVGGGDGPLTASLVASRTSCTAPCAIHFDATGTTHETIAGLSATSATTNVFRAIGYYFSYGDTSPGSWRYSQNGTHTSKNYDRGGPIGAHVYETAGQYTAKVRARDPNGNVDDAQVTISVADPNTTYSGTATVCLSRNTDHTGCPIGATQISNVSSWPSFASNTRFLLHAGQNFSSLGGINIAGATNTRVNVAIGKYGSGGSPVVSGINVDSEPPGPSRTTWSSNIMISDIDFNGRPFSSTQAHTDVLCLRCTNISASGNEAAIGLGGSVFYYGFSSNSGTTTAANIYYPRFTFFVDCEVSGGEYNYTGWGRGNVIMGCNLQNPRQHNVRYWNAYKTLVQHNNVTGAAPEKVNIKLHSGGDGAWDDNPTNKLYYGNAATYYFIARENVIGGGSNSWAVTFSPETQEVSGSTFVQGISDSIAEDNYFSKKFSSEFIFDGRRLTARGNTVVSGSPNHGGSQAAVNIPSGWNLGNQTGAESITTEAPQ